MRILSLTQFKQEHPDYNKKSSGVCEYWSRDIGVRFPLTQTLKVFILLHELGHLKLNTGDELKASRWAFQCLPEQEQEEVIDKVCVKLRTNYASIWSLKRIRKYLLRRPK